MATELEPAVPGGAPLEADEDEEQWLYGGRRPGQRSARRAGGLLVSRAGGRAEGRPSHSAPWLGPRGIGLGRPAHAAVLRLG